MKQHYELTSTPELLTLASYVSKDGLVSHHWKEAHWTCKLYMPQYRGPPGPKSGSGWLGEWGGEEYIGDFLDSIGNVMRKIPNKKLIQKKPNEFMKFLVLCVIKYHLC